MTQSTHGATFTGGAERRRSARRRLDTVGTILPDADPPASGPALLVNVIDVSDGGVGFRSAASFHVGQRWRVRIGTGPVFVESRMEVVSCRPRPDATYDVGAKYL